MTRCALRGSVRCFSVGLVTALFGCGALSVKAQQMISPEDRQRLELQIQQTGTTVAATSRIFGRHAEARKLAGTGERVGACIAFARLFDDASDDEAMKIALPIFGAEMRRRRMPVPTDAQSQAAIRAAEAADDQPGVCVAGYDGAYYALWDGDPIGAEAAMTHARAAYARVVQAATAGAETGKAAGELAAEARVGGRRVALLIANAAYDPKANVPALRTPEHDADLIAAALRKAGFVDVEIVRNAGKARMVEALGRFRDKAAQADTALVYFAGHGLQHDNQNFALPVDARLADEAAVADEALSQQALLDAMAGVGKLKILVMDACRNNPFTATGAQADAAGTPAAAGVPPRSLTRGLVRIVPPKSHSVILYSAGPGQTAQDGDPDSPFATSLARHMLEPGIEIGVMLRQVSADVEAATKNAQRPDSAGNLGADPFFFIAPKS